MTSSTSLMLSHYIRYVSITSRIVLAIPLDEIEVQRDISRPELLARVC